MPFGVPGARTDPVAGSTFSCSDRVLAPVRDLALLGFRRHQSAASRAPRASRNTFVLLGMKRREGSRA